jgi:hypothetical protein
MSESFLPAQASAAGAPAIDRRAHIRYAPAPETSCQVTAGGNNSVWWASVLDIATGGIGLVVSRRFEPGTLLAIGVENKDREFSHMRATTSCTPCCKTPPAPDGRRGSEPSLPGAVCSTRLIHTTVGKQRFGVRPGRRWLRRLPVSFHCTAWGS